MWRIASESEQPEALAFYAGQLINIRFDQGRLHELEPLIAQQVEANPGIPAFRGALTLARSEAGMRDEALEVLAVDSATEFSEIDYDSNWLAGIAIYAEACGILGHRDAAAKLHRLLAPVARPRGVQQRHHVGGLVERLLGNLSRVLGHYDEAKQALARASERHEQMGAPIGWPGRGWISPGCWWKRGGEPARAAPGCSTRRWVPRATSGVLGSSVRRSRCCNE